MVWICACRPRVMRLCGMEVFFLLRSPFHTVGKSRIFSFFFFFFALCSTFGSKNRWKKIDFFLSSIPANPLSILTFNLKMCLITVWTLKNGSAEDSGICLAFCIHQLCIYVRVTKYLAAVHCKDPLWAMRSMSKVLLYGGVASMSLYERVQKGVLVGPSFTQGPKGSRGSSGSRGLKTSERGRNTETEEEKQRWAEMGRMAGRQTAEEFFF